MNLYGNLSDIADVALKCERVLDVGGWCGPLNVATHVIDIGAYDTRHQNDALGPDQPQRFSKDTWTIHDVCKAPWPFPDKFFDFSFCSHLLEDVRDPLTVCSELMRVSKAGYLETPTRMREIFCKARGFEFMTLLGRMPKVGFFHHRWFVEMKDNHIKFTAKDQRLLMRREHFITRGDLGRKMTREESGQGMFWKDSFTCEEFFPDDMWSDLKDFRQTAYKKLRGR